MPKLSLALLALLAARALSAQATDTARAAPVVVSATRMPMTQGALPVAVTIISGDDLRLRGVTTVSEALGDVTSAYVAQTGSQGGTTSLFLRGGESKYVKVLVDGVPANDPGGTYDFASLTTDNVERIEVVRGPASVIHGADAVTGVVNVITRRGTGVARTDIDVRTGMAPRERLGGAGSDPGSARTFDVTGGVSGGLSAGSYSFSLARHQANGLYQLNNRYQNNVLSGRFLFTPASGTDLRLAVRYNDYQYNYPTDGGGTVVDANAYRVEDRTVIGAELERRIMPTLRAVLSVNSSVNEGGTDDAMDDPTGSSFVSQDKTRRRGAELRVHLLPVNVTALTIGANVEQQDQRSQLQSESSFGPFTSRFRAARRNTGVYAEAVATPSSTLTVTLGARVDENQQFGQFTTARGGVSWRATSTTRLRATAGTAFREPSFFENFSTGFVTGNPDLRPERTRSVDAGVEQEVAGGRAQIAVTAFGQTFTDMIDYTGGTTACGYSYCNVASARSNGVEAEVRARVASAITATVGATVLETKVLEPGYDNTSGGLYHRGESLIRRPAHTYDASLVYQRGSRLSGTAHLHAVGRRTDRDFRAFPATPVTLEPYQRVDLSAAYALRQTGSERTSLTARVENVLNARYVNVFNFLTPRRTVTLGIRTSF